MTRAIATCACACALAFGCGPKRGGTVATGHGHGSASGSGSTTAATALDWSKAGVDWDHPPGGGPEPTWTPQVPQAFTLDNGVHVLLVENHRLPLISVRVVLPRAGAREDGKATGLASFTADLLDEGAGNLDALAFPAAVEKLGARMDTAVSEDATVVWLDTLASTLDDSLGMLSDVVMRPRFAAKDVARVRADTLEELKQRPEDPRRVAALVFDRVVFGAHPYGAPVSGEPDTVAKLDRKAVVAFWKKHYVPSDATVVIVGDLDRATAHDLLTKRLGGWKGKALPGASAVMLPAAPAPALVFVDRPGASQSVVMIGRRALAAADPSYFPEEVVNMAIGGSFAARLNKRIREELGYTYGVTSGFWRGRLAGTWTATMSLETSVTLAGIQEAQKILDDAEQHPLPAAELEKSQQLMTRALPQGFESDDQIAGEFAELIVDGQPLDWFTSYDAGVRAVTADVGQQTIAAAWKELSIVVVGDWAKVGADLTKLGLPIQRVDVEGQPVH